MSDSDTNDHFKRLVAFNDFPPCVKRSHSITPMTIRVGYNRLMS